MPLWVDGFICLPLSPFCLPVWMLLWVDGFICLPLSPSLDVCHGSPGGRIHLSPLVPLHLSPISAGGRIDLSPFVSLYLSPVVSQPGCLSGWTDSFVSLCLPFVSQPECSSGWTDSFVSRCLPAWMCSLSCGCWGQGPLSALHLDFGFAWARGGSSSLSIVGYTLSVRSVPRYQLRPLSVLARIWSPELTRAVRCGAWLQLREGSVNPPVKQT